MVWLYPLYNDFPKVPKLVMGKSALVIATFEKGSSALDPSCFHSFSAPSAVEAIISHHSQRSYNTLSIVEAW